MIYDFVSFEERGDTYDVCVVAVELYICVEQYNKLILRHDVIDSFVP